MFKATGDRREQAFNLSSADSLPRLVKVRAMVNVPRLRVVDGLSKARLVGLVSARVLAQAVRVLLAVIRGVLVLPVLPPRNLARSFRHLGASRILLDRSVGTTILWAASLPTEVLILPVRSIRRHTEVRTPALEKPAAVIMTGLLLLLGEVLLAELLSLDEYFATMRVVVVRSVSPVACCLRTTCLHNYK